jgi:hypothetical protein
VNLDPKILVKNPPFINEFTVIAEVTVIGFLGKPVEKALAEGAISLCIKSSSLLIHVLS